MMILAQNREHIYQFIHVSITVKYSFNTCQMLVCVYYNRENSNKNNNKNVRWIIFLIRFLGILERIEMS